MTTDKAVSEIVGALILVALVIAGLGIASVVLFSTPPPEAREKAVLSSSCVDCDGSRFVIVVRHEGGDVVNRDRLLFNLQTMKPDRTYYETIKLNPTYYYPADDYSHLSRSNYCTIPGLDFDSMTTFKNGDAISIQYTMTDE